MAVLEFDNLNRDEDVDEDDEWVHYQNEKKKKTKKKISKLIATV